MLELYEQNRAAQSSHPNEVEGSTGVGANQLAKAISTVTENSASVSGPSQDVTTVTVKHETQVVPPPRPVPAQVNANSSRTVPQSTRNRSSDNGSVDTGSGVWDHNMEGEGKDGLHCRGDQNPYGKEYEAQDLSCSKSSLQQPIQDGVNEKGRTVDARDLKDESSLPKSGNTSTGDSRYSDAITKIDKDKVKAALEKRRKSRTDVSKKTDIIDEDDLIERELENGIEMAAEDDKTKCEKRNGWPQPLNSHHQASHGKINDKSFEHGFEENGEEGELSSLEEHDLPSPKLQKNKGTGWPDTERDHKRLRCEFRG